MQDEAIRTHNTCIKCGISKEWEAFPPNSRMHSGRTNMCRDCSIVYNKKIRDANKDQTNRKRRERKKNDPEWREHVNKQQRESRRERMKDDEYREADKLYHKNQRQVRKKDRVYTEALRLQNREYWQNKRRTVIDHYAPDHQCRMCRLFDVEALQIDHVNGDGRMRRRELGINRNTEVLNIIRDGFPPDFQILCAGCNYIKGSLTQAEFEAKYPHRINMHA